jgi:hypothetical protein
MQLANWFYVAGSMGEMVGEPAEAVELEIEQPRRIIKRHAMDGGG